MSKMYLEFPAEIPVADRRAALSRIFGVSGLVLTKQVPDLALHSEGFECSVFIDFDPKALGDSDSAQRLEAILSGATGCNVQQHGRYSSTYTYRFG